MWRSSCCDKVEKKRVLLEIDFNVAPPATKIGNQIRHMSAAAIVLVENLTSGLCKINSTGVNRGFAGDYWRNHMIEETKEFINVFWRVLHFPSSTAHVNSHPLSLFWLAYRSWGNLGACYKDWFRSWGNVIVDLEGFSEHIWSKGCLDISHGTNDFYLFYSNVLSRSPNIYQTRLGIYEQYFD